MKDIPAFPQSIMEGSTGGVVGGCDFSGRYEGMTLRDWFAGQALMGILCQHWTEESQYSVLIAKDAYKYADAMLKEREQP